MIVSVNTRAAIFDEHFPAEIIAAGDDVTTWFSHDEAHHVLYTFAGAWPGLGRDHDDDSTRYLYRSNGEIVCRFRGVQLTPNAIVVDGIVAL